MASDPTTGSIFPRTDWAELSKAAEAQQVPLDRLIRVYWQPLKIFLLTTFPTLKDEAEIILQDFAEDKMLKEGWLKKADLRSAAASAIFSKPACAISCSTA